MPGVARPFFTARWQHLLIITHEVDPALLIPLLPPGLEPDLFEGRAHVSLVAFEFARLRIGGVPIPGASDFPEVNLRTYVREAGGVRRGVLFIREFVPRRLVTLAARVFYNEPYITTPMTWRLGRHEGSIRVEHDITRGGRRHGFVVDAGHPPVAIREGSREHWFLEQEWGFGADRRGRALVYRVEHPPWRVHPGPRLRMDADFAALYGPPWGILNAPPAFTTLVEGSPVAVFPCGRLGAGCPASV